MSAPPRTEIPDVTAIDRTLATDRLVLRPHRLDDLDALWPHVSNPELSRQMTWTAHADKAETRAYLESVIQPSATDLVWAVERGGALIGSIGLHGISYAFRALRRDRAEIGYWIGLEHGGKGYATEATRAVMAFAFDQLGLNKLTISCLATNTASRRVIEKCGFRFYGRQEDDVWRDGAWHAHLRYELLVRDWSDITTTMPISMPPSS